MSYVLSPISRQIWDEKYRFKTADGKKDDHNIEGTWKRIAHALAAAEKDPAYWEPLFYDALSGFKFLPGGRIISGAGTKRSVTLFNCFVMGTIPDSMDGIFEMLKEAALTMQQGGGIGYDFSTLRPLGAFVKGIGADASGPASFMNVWDSMCRTIMSSGQRRGAMMGVMRCDHPDIEAFVEAKRDATRLRMFNLSVLVTDAFIEAVETDAQWPLVFDGQKMGEIRAVELWEKIMQSTYDYAEPGVIFIDRINQLNNLRYCETISATNPCGEQPLPPYGACLLGSINLAALVRDPFGVDAALDLEALTPLVKTSVRMMDNVIDISRFPLSAQEKEAQAKRRIGLGITGLADALAMLGMRYGSSEAVSQTEIWLEALANAAYAASAELACEKGRFPLYKEAPFLEAPIIKRLTKKTQTLLKKHGSRNALLTSIAPTGTISLLAGNVSSGIEPIFATAYKRKFLQKDGTKKEAEIMDYAVALWREKNADAPLPDYFVTAQDLKPVDHLRMQSAAQKWIDSAISKTINCPEDIAFADFKDIYIEAWRTGCKGCTTYRPNAITGSVLSSDTASKPAKKSNVDVVYIAQPLARPDALLGKTYKIKWPNSPHAIYITLNDIEINGQRRPFEIFINSKDMAHFPWTVALTRMISAVFRRGGDTSFVGEELKAIFDPTGGAWVEGKYIPSIIAAIGGVIDTHLKDITQSASSTKNEKDTKGKGTATCMNCGSYSLSLQEGCATCLECGHSKCG